MATATKAKRKSSTKSQPTVSVIFSTFDSKGNDPIYRTPRSCSLQDWKNITTKDYNPWGGTPLLDATAQFIAHLDKNKKKGTVVIGILADESGSMSGNTSAVVNGINEFVNGMKDVDNVDPEADGKVLAVIFTDGYENSSSEVIDISGLIRKKESEGWTFIYLGANQDAWSVGRQTGFSGTSSGATFDWAPTAAGTSSTLRNVGTMSSLYLTSNKAYEDTSETISGGSLAEDGTVTNSAGETYDINDALNKAKEKK